MPNKIRQTDIELERTQTGALTGADVPRNTDSSTSLDEALMAAEGSIGTLQDQVAALQAAPVSRVGDVLQSATIPPGGTWLRCDGKTYTQTTYNDLFSKLGHLDQFAFNRSAPLNIDANGMAYANGMYVAVGSNAIVMTSTNGLDWIPRYCPTTVDDGQVLRDVAYGNGTFVTVGANGTIATSPNGITWTLQPTPGSGGDHFMGVAFGNGVFVVGGTGPQLFSSPDGVTWTARTAAAFSSDPINGVNFGDGVFVLYGGTSSEKMAESTDGITWTTIPGGSFGGNVANMLKAGGVYVANAASKLYVSTNPSSGWTLKGTYGTIVSMLYENGLYLMVNSGSEVVRSTDGATWTYIASALGLNVTRAATYGNGQFVAFGSVTTGAVSVVSATGEVWSGYVPSVGVSAIRGFARGADQFVCVADSGRVSTSPDGHLWAKRFSGVTSALNSVTYGNNTYVAVGASNVILTSPDGVTWTSQTSGLASVTFTSVAYGNGLFLAGTTGGDLVTSPDGMTWTPRSLGFSTTAVRAILYANSTFIVAGDAAKLATSSNGTSWTIQTSSFTSTDIYCLTFGNGMFVAAGASGKIATSTNGSSWTQQTSPFSSNAVRSLSYGNGYYVAGGDNGTLYGSIDAATWTARPVGFSTQAVNAQVYYYNTFLLGGGSGFYYNSQDTWAWSTKAFGFGLNGASTAAYKDGRWVIAGGKGFIATSDDEGHTWIGRNSGTNQDLWCSTASSALFVVAGNNGTLLTSSDGITWTSRTSGFSTSTINALANNGDQIFVAAGVGGKISASTNGGSTWSIQTHALGANGFLVTSLTYGNGMFVAGNEVSADVTTSSNGTTWTTRTVGVTGGVYSIAYNGRIFLCVGTTAGIFSSTDGINWRPVVNPASTANERVFTADGNRFILMSGGGIFKVSPDGTTSATNTYQRWCSTSSFYAFVTETSFIALNGSGGVGRGKVPGYDPLISFRVPALTADIPFWIKAA